MLRITPGVDPHTHQFTSTGTIDSKFGIPLPLKEEAVKKAVIQNLEDFIRKFKDKIYWDHIIFITWERKCRKL
jgi:hypothetical protein